MAPIGMKFGIIALAGASGGNGLTTEIMTYNSQSGQPVYGTFPQMVGIEAYTEYTDYGLQDLGGATNNGYAQAVNHFTVGAGMPATLSFYDVEKNTIQMGFKSSSRQNIMEGEFSYESSYIPDGAYLGFTTAQGGKYRSYSDLDGQQNFHQQALTNALASFQYRFDEDGTATIFTSVDPMPTSSGTWTQRTTLPQSWTGSFVPIVFDIAATAHIRGPVKLENAFQTAVPTPEALTGASLTTGLDTAGTIAEETNDLVYFGSTNNANNARTQQTLTAVGDYFECTWYNPSGSSVNISSVGIGDGADDSNPAAFGFRFSNTQGGRTELYADGSIVDSQTVGRSYTMASNWMNFKFEIVTGNKVAYYINNYLFYTSTATISLPAKGEMMQGADESGWYNIKIKST